MNTLQAKNTSLVVRVVGLLALVFIIGTQAAATPEPAKVLLLLHGMNSDPSTWNDFVDRKFGNSCVIIADGVLIDNSTPNLQGVLCYRIRFGSFDSISGRVGVEGITAASPSSGDFSTFKDLGREVRRAVRGILNRHGNAETVLVAHSRGGDAARTFLQQQIASQAKASVIGLLTTGTPHRGSQLGRIYKYLEAHPRETCCQADWKVVDFLRGNRKCAVGLVRIENPTPLDVRRPTIGDLADDSPAISELNQGISLLPAAIQYGQIVYRGLGLGILKIKIPLFKVYSVFDREGKSDICDQVSKEAEGFILDDTKPNQYPGDGVISAANQRYFNLSGFPGDPTKLHRLRVDDRITHTEETGQEAHISKVLTEMMGSWWTGASLASQGSEQETPARGGGEPSAAPGSVEARQQYFDRLVEQPPDSLWSYWQQLLNDQQMTQLEIATYALAYRLHQAGNEEIYSGIAQVLGESSLSIDQKRWVVDLLTETATPEALRVVLNEAVNSSPSALRRLLLESIVRVTNNRWDARFHSELSPVLEEVWNQQPGDWESLLAVARGIANVGSKRGVTVLLRAVADSGPIITEIEKGENLPAVAALQALKKIRNPEGVPILARELTRADLEDVVFIASGDALAAMGRSEATEVLLEWAKQAPREAAPLVERWFRQVRDSVSLESLHKELLQSKPFRSERIKEKLAVTLKDIEPVVESRVLPLE
jgi:hypothetical protein